LTAIRAGTGACPYKGYDPMNWEIANCEMRIAKLKRLCSSIFCFSLFAIRLPQFLFWWLPKTRAGTGACPYEDHKDGYDPPSECRYLSISVSQYISSVMASSRGTHPVSAETKSMVVMVLVGLGLSQERIYSYVSWPAALLGKWNATLSAIGGSVHQSRRSSPYFISLVAVVLSE
jgi:hypothetical protein